MNDKKRVLKEFEWFEVQTKVRQIIAQVIEPLQKKILANTLSLSKLANHSDQQQKKVEYLTLMVSDDPHIFQHGIFSTIDNKISEAKVHSKQLQSKVVHLQEFIERKVELLQMRLRESGQVLQGLRQFRQHVEDEISNQNNKLVESQQNLFANFDQINTDISSALLSIQALRKQETALREKVVELEQRVHQTGTQVENAVSSFREQIRQTILKQQRQAEIVESLQQQIKRVGRFQKYTRQLQFKIESLAIAVENVEYKAEVIQPIVSLTQINEYAHHILPPAFTNNISIYYYNRYRQMVQEIINGEVDRQQKKIKVKSQRKINLQLIKQVHKRSIKCVFKLKKQRLAEKGIDIDSLPHDKKQELLSNLQIDEELSEVMVHKDADQKVENREKQTMEEYNQLKDTLISQLRARIQQELKDSKQYIINMEDQLKREIAEVQSKIDILNKTVKQNEINMELQAKAGHQFQNKITKSWEKMQIKMQRVYECLKDMNTVVGVHQLIEKQDERDRLSMTLFGVRQKHRDEIKQSRSRRNSIELSESCLSCSGNPNYYNQFFKMACLNYTSSPIRLNNHSYQRIELLDTMQNELAKIKEHLQLLAKPQENKANSRKDEERRAEDKMQRYESQIMAVPIQDNRSKEQHYTVRNISSSQEMRYSKADKSIESPRIINSSEIIENLMNKKANRLFNHKRDALKDYKFRKESHSRQSKQRSEYMVNVGNYFKQLRKQNEQFLK